MSQPESAGEPPPKPRFRRRRTRFAKLLMLLTGASAAAVLGCCIFMLAFPVEVLTEPAAIEGLAGKFGPLKYPAHFQPATGLSADNSMMWVQIARFEQSDGRGQLVIGGLHMRTQGDADKIDALWLDWLFNQLAPRIRLLDVQNKREKTIEIRGKQAVFEIVEGEDRSSTTRFKQVSGSFPVPVGTARLVLQAEEGFLTDQAIDELLESLAQPDANHP